MWGVIVVPGIATLILLPDAHAHAVAPDLERDIAGVGPVQQRENMQAGQHGQNRPSQYIAAHNLGHNHDDGKDQGDPNGYLGAAQLAVIVGNQVAQHHPNSLPARQRS